MTTSPRDSATPCRDITDADDPNLTRYLIQEEGKLLIYHGWADTIIPAEPIVDYYNEGSAPPTTATERLRMTL